MVDFLAREGALLTDDSPSEIDGEHRPDGGWPQIEEDEEVLELDWGRLFPRRVADRDGDFELFGDQEWDPGQEVLSDLDGVLGAGEDGVAGPPGWDRCAWYQPIHFFGLDWGIFIYEHCIEEAARDIACFLPPWATPSGQLRKSLLRSAFSTLFLHEQYHHKTESLGIRLHVSGRVGRYVPYFRSVYLPSRGSDDQLEEGLANADSYHRLTDKPYSTWTPKGVRRPVRDYLHTAFRLAPPGYRLAEDLIPPHEFDYAECELQTQVNEGTLSPTQDPADWALAPQMSRSLFTVAQPIWVVVKKGARPAMPVHPGVTAPLSSRDLSRALRKWGYTENTKRGKGSHTVFEAPGEPLVVLPHAKDLSPQVLRTTAKALGLDSVRELEDEVRAA